MFMRRWSVTALTLLLVAVLASCASTGCAASRDKVTRELVTEGPVQEAWLRFYREGVGFGGEALALDNAGNVYASGSCGFTVKYDSEGKRIWATRYAGRAADLVLDAAGNVYVTGSEVTAKYDKNGKKLWTTSLDKGDQATAMAIDSQCNVYVTGSSYPTGYTENFTGFDYVTTKYDTNGRELWTSHYDGTLAGRPDAHPYSDDTACGIAVDASGNAYVTGGSKGSDFEYDYATVKYDTDGHEIWVRRYDNPSSGFDRAEAVIIDTFGYIYVTGQACTIKYDSSGEQMPLGGSPGWLDGPRVGTSGIGLALDDSGNVYVVGSVIAKYDSDGYTEWHANVDIGNEIRAFALDDSGNIYVAGKDCSLAKYDSNGTRVWAVRYEGSRKGSSSNYSGEYEAVAVDAYGNVFVTGRVLTGVGDPILWEGSERWYYAFAVGKYTDDVSE
jgi:hypothetical protein